LFARDDALKLAQAQLKEFTDKETKATKEVKDLQNDETKMKKTLETANKNKEAFEQ